MHCFFFFSYLLVADHRVVVFILCGLTSICLLVMGVLAGADEGAVRRLVLSWLPFLLLFLCMCVYARVTLEGTPAEVYVCDSQALSPHFLSPLCLVLREVLITAVTHTHTRGPVTHPPFLTSLFFCRPVCVCVLALCAFYLSLPVPRSPLVCM